MELAQRLDEGFAAAFGSTPSIVARAPGRVNLIGEHTDYNAGFAMPMAISRETRVAFRPTSGESLRVAALDFGDSDDVSLGAIERLPDGGWRNYVRGVLHELARAGAVVRGGEMAIAGDIAKGTGLSSSASLEVAVARAMIAATGHSLDAVPLALLAQRAECDFVGVRCGNLDQLAAAASAKGHALLIDCRSLVLRQVALPADLAVMIVQSGVVRGLVDGEYNLRRAQCEAAATTLGVAALRDVDETMLEGARAELGEITFRRARHVVTENCRTLEATEALADDDLVRTGALLRESQASQRDDFAITVPETDRLVEVMNAAIGAEGGARQTGGGFGGAVIGLMRRDRVADVAAAVRENYRTPHGRLPEIAVERAAAGASLIG